MNGPEAVTLTTAFRRAQAFVARARRWRGVSLALRLGALLLTFVAVERWAFALGMMSPEEYARPVILAGIARALFSAPTTAPADLFQVGSTVALVFAIARFRKQLLRPWGQLPDGNVLRIVVAVPVLLLGWAYSAYDFNLFLGQAHLADRFALIALTALVLWRPAFALPFGVLIVAMAWQFNYPIGGYSVAEQFMLLRMILLFVAYLILLSFGFRTQSSDLVFLILTLVASSYAVAGLGKIRLEWFSLGHVALLIPATHANGWLGWIDAPEIDRLTSTLLSLDPLLVAGALIVECGALFALTRRGVLLACLPIWIAFHLLAWGMSGIFFWKWIAVEATLFVLFVKRAKSPALSIFTTPHAGLSVLMVAGGTVWFQPVNLTWLNAAVSYTYRFEAVAADGSSSWLPPTFFAPYDYQFTQTLFDYLSPYQQLPVYWGAVYDRRLAEAMIAAETEADVAALEAADGVVFFNEGRAERFDHFVRAFVGNWNERKSKRTIFSSFQAPPQLWTTSSDLPPARAAPVTEVVVHRVTSFFDGSTYREINPRRVRSIVISAGS